MHRKMYKRPLFFFFSSIAVIVAFLIIGVLFFHQIILGAEVRDRDITASSVLPEKESRYTIFFTDKNNYHHPVANIKDKYSLFVDPEKIDDIHETYGNIETIISLNEEEFAARIAHKDSRYTEIKDALTQEEYKQFQEQKQIYKLPGLSVSNEKTRAYPFNSLAAQLIGFVGFNNAQQYGGQYGLERQYDSFLRYTIDRYSHIDEYKDIFTYQGDEAAEGDIITSIHIDVQRLVEQELEKIDDAWDPESVGAIIMDPTTGYIRAMAAHPTFDLNNFNKFGSVIHRNSNIEDVYEMGSVFKPLTIAIALHSGSIDEDFTYDDTGEITANGETVRNHDQKAYGEDVPLQEILDHSLNIGAASVMLATGKDVMRSYLEAFDFGGLTDIDLPGEVKGLTSNLNSDKDIEFITASYGHGLAVTPIAMIRALATLANGGFLVTPKIVTHKRINDRLFPVHRDKPPKHIFDTETTNIVKNMLGNAFDTALLGGTLKKEHYRIASKTGTATISNKAEGGYYEDKVVHSFFGFLPVSDPEFIVFLFAVDPKNDGSTQNLYASHTLARPFNRIADFLIQHYAITPDR